MLDAAAEQYDDALASRNDHRAARALEEVRAYVDTSRQRIHHHDLHALCEWADSGQSVGRKFDAALDAAVRIRARARQPHGETVSLEPGSFTMGWARDNLAEHALLIQFDAYEILQRRVQRRVTELELKLKIATKAATKHQRDAVRQDVVDEQARERLVTLEKRQTMIRKIINGEVYGL